jgi:hypothetical protein
MMTTKITRFNSLVVDWPLFAYLRVANGSAVPRLQPSFRKPKIFIPSQESKKEFGTLIASLMIMSALLMQSNHS